MSEISGIARPSRIRSKQTALKTEDVRTYWELLPRSGRLIPFQFECSNSDEVWRFFAYDWSCLLTSREQQAMHTCWVEHQSRWRSHLHHIWLAEPTFPTRMNPSSGLQTVTGRTRRTMRTTPSARLRTIQGSFGGRTARICTRCVRIGPSPDTVQTFASRSTNVYGAEPRLRVKADSKRRLSAAAADAACRCIGR